MRFEWHEAKSKANLAARGFDFEFASTVFADPLVRYEPARIIAGELRFSAIGKAGRFLLFVVFTVRSYENETIYRIISARQAHKKERGRYSALHEV
jgi:uncharacterized DUF497 family protein